MRPSTSPTYFEDGHITVAPKTSSRVVVRNGLNLAAERAFLSRGMAAKLRGKSGWVATNTFGRCGRLGASILKDIQYSVQPESLLPFQIQGLQLHSLVVTSVPPKSLRILGAPARPVVIYTDAEYSPGAGSPPRLGWVCFEPG